MVFWKSVKSNPNEYLIVGHHGKITNHGTGASALLTRGATYVIIPSTKQEAKFVMTQESKDGIPHADITREKVRLQQDLRHEELEAEAPIRLLQIEQQREVLTQELETHRLKLEYYVNLFAFIERMINTGKKGFSTFFEEKFKIPQFGLRFRS